MQFTICEPYPAPRADYHVIELRGSSPQKRPSRFEELEDWSLADTYDTFDVATKLARELCVSKGVEVWVVDRNDGDFVALRVSPEEYSRSSARQEPATAA